MNWESLMDEPGFGGLDLERPGRRNKPGAVVMPAAPLANRHRVFLQARSAFQVI
jgi:hypothetical protein